MKGSRAMKDVLDRRRRRRARAVISFTLTESDVSSILGIHKSILRKWRARGRGPKFRKIGPLTRYCWRDVALVVSEDEEAHKRFSALMKRRGLTMADEFDARRSLMGAGKMGRGNGLSKAASDFLRRAAREIRAELAAAGYAPTERDRAKGVRELYGWQISDRTLAKHIVGGVPRKVHNAPQ